MPIITSTADPDYREQDWPPFICSGCGQTKRLATEQGGHFCVDCYAGAVGRVKQEHGHANRSG